MKKHYGLPKREWQKFDKSLNSKLEFYKDAHCHAVRDGDRVQAESLHDLIYELDRFHRIFKGRHSG